MKRAKKLIETIILVIVILLALFLLAFELFGEHIIKTGIETAGTKALKVGVAIDDLDLSIYKGNVRIKGLAVDNPAGYEQQYLMQLGTGKVDTNMKSLLSDTVEIESILLDKITLSIEQKGLNNNLQDILKSLPKSEPSEPKEEPEPEAKPGKSLVVKDLKITNTTVKVKLLPVQILPGQADTVTLELDPIEMKNLGSDDKLTTAKLASKVMVAIAQGVAKQGTGKLPEDLLGSMEDTLKNLGSLTDTLRQEGQKLLESGGKNAEEIIEQGQESGKELIEGVKGLFDKKEEK
jgi:hypothetical protein